MDKEEYIKVRWELTLPPDIVAFIEFEAKRLTEERRDATPDVSEIITIEHVASQLLHGGALMAYMELSEKMSDEDIARYLPMIRPDDTKYKTADRSSEIVVEDAEPIAVDTNQEAIDEGTAARVAELMAEGHGEEAHELAKTIEIPSIRREVDPEN